MKCKYDWFLLPDNLIETLQAPQGASGFDVTAYNKIVEGIKWHSLTVDLTIMAAIVNKTTVQVDSEYLWNRLPEQLFKFCEFIDNL